MANFQDTIIHPEGGAAQTFEPEDRVNGTSVFKFDSPDGPLGDQYLTVRVSTSKSGRKTTRAKLSVPVVLPATASAPAQLLRTAYATIEVNFDASASDAERDTLVEMARNCLIGANNELSPAFRRGQGLW